MKYFLEHQTYGFFFKIIIFASFLRFFYIYATGGVKIFVAPCKSHGFFYFLCSLYNLIIDRSFKIYNNDTWQSKIKIKKSKMTWL